jgi:ribonuclease PH
MPTRRRAADRLRRVRITPDYITTADGSCLIAVGRTRVVCTATIEDRVPRWLLGTGGGWVTAEYGMLPASAKGRIRRPGPGGTSSRGTEIRRLIGRALRAGMRLEALGQNQIIVDCDVLEADGGTRCAAITGGWVALARAVAGGRDDGRLPADTPDPVTEQVVATSCGIVEGRPLLDLDYADDSAADVDANIVMTASGRLIEVQASGEEATFTAADLSRLLRLARAGCETLAEHQARAVQRG